MLSCGDRNYKKNFKKIDGLVNGNYDTYLVVKQIHLADFSMSVVRGINATMLHQATVYDY